FGTACAAIGVGRHLVGEDTRDVDIHRGNFVAARDHQRGELRDERRQELVVGADIRDLAQLQAEDGAVFFQGEFEVIDGVAAVDGGGDVLAPGLNPLHRLAEFHGKRGNEAFFAIDIQLAAEAAADLGSDDAHGSFRQADHQGNLCFQQVGNL